MGLLEQHLKNHDVLIRLNAFLLSYFGWMGFGVLYGVIGRWSVDVTAQFLRLPFTSRDFVLQLVDFTHSIPPLYILFHGIYYIGFAGSIALIVAYVLVYLADLPASDELLVRYLMAYGIAGAIYLCFHVYAPHVVYNLPGYPLDNTLLTRQEFVFPSLHNTFAAINIITLWKYRDRLGGKLLILVNALVPFATVFLAHHWVYDVIAGILLGVIISKYSEGWRARISHRLYNVDVASLQRITALNALLAIIVLMMALNPQRAIALIGGILNRPAP